MKGAERRDKLTPELGFRVGFRVRISSWIFELGFRVGFSSWIFELRFRVRIFELGCRVGFFDMVTSNPAATNRLLCG